MKIYFSFFAALLLVSNVYAQQDSGIVVHKDPRIDILTAKYEAAKPVAKKSVTSVAQVKKGYRVQVINTRNRDEAFNVKAALLKNFSSQKTYLIFQSPYFKVRIGNFISRSEAEKFKMTLSKQYGSGVYIVEDVVEIVNSQ